MDGGSTAEKACFCVAKHAHGDAVDRILRLESDIFIWMTHSPGFDQRLLDHRHPDAHMLLMIDNYDSFTFNLVQYLGELGQQVKVIRNDAMDIAAIRALEPERIMISPGPGTPDDSGVSMDILREMVGELPIFGVCLGHQAIGQIFGGKVIRAERIMHGKTSPVHHRGEGVFAGLPDPFEATRYHSLLVDKTTVPDCLRVTAWTEKSDGSLDEIMGLKHKTLPIEGVQFHPESILTRHGHDMLRNFLATPSLEPA